MDKIVYGKNTIEFVTVATEFCAFVERAETMDRSEFVGTVLKILPLLYLKATMLPHVVDDDDSGLESYVTEETYEILRMNIASLMGDMDDYLEVFEKDMVYSDKPILATVSENIVDIYQDVRDFIFAFQLGYEDSMKLAVKVCVENFELYWGQKLVNVMRALHNIKYNMHHDDDCECCNNDSGNIDNNFFELE